MSLELTPNDSAIRRDPAAQLALMLAKELWVLKDRQLVLERYAFTSLGLRAVFGVSEVDDEARRSPLAEYLLRPGSAARYGSSDSRLTVDAMWSIWLANEWGLDTQGGLALDTMLAKRLGDGT